MKQCATLPPVEHSFAHYAARTRILSMILVINLLILDIATTTAVLTERIEDYEDDNETAQEFAKRFRHSSVLPIDPYSYKRIINGSQSFIGIFYSEKLPQWKTIEPVIMEMASFYEDYPEVRIALGDCHKYKQFTKEFAFGALPVILLFIENLKGIYPFEIKYRPENTALDYIQKIEKVRVKSANLFGDTRNLLDKAASAVIESEKVKLLEIREKREWKRNGTIPSKNGTSEESVVTGNASSSVALQQEYSHNKTFFPRNETLELRRQSNYTWEKVFLTADMVIQDLQNRLEKAQFVRDYVLPGLKEKGYGFASSELNFRLSALFGNTVKQFVDETKRDNLIMEITSLQPMVDAFIRESYEQQTAKSPHQS